MLSPPAMIAGIRSRFRICSPGVPPVRRNSGSAPAILIVAGIATPGFNLWFGTAGAPVAVGKSTLAPVRLKKRCAKRPCSSAVPSPGRRFFYALPCSARKPVLSLKIGLQPNRAATPEEEASNGKKHALGLSRTSSASMTSFCSQGELTPQKPRSPWVGQWPSLPVILGANTPWPVAPFCIWRARPKRAKGK